MLLCFCCCSCCSCCVNNRCTGRTPEGKADLERLALIRKQREEAKQKREEAGDDSFMFFRLTSIVGLGAYYVVIDLRYE